MTAGSAINWHVNYVAFKNPSAPNPAPTPQPTHLLTMPHVVVSPSAISAKQTSAYRQENTQVLVNVTLQQATRLSNLQKDQFISAFAASLNIPANGVKIIVAHTVKARTQQRLILEMQILTSNTASSTAVTRKLQAPSFPELVKAE
jgi:hypothetical protein